VVGFVKLAIWFSAGISLYWLSPIVEPCGWGRDAFRRCVYICSRLRRYRSVRLSQPCIKAIRDGTPILRDKPDLQRSTFYPVVYRFEVGLVFCHMAWGERTRGEPGLEVRY
jgi:hypothetical protein